MTVDDFERIVRQKHRVYCGVAAKQVGDDAEDLVQDTYLIVLRKLHIARGEPFVFGVLRNRLMDVRRAQIKRALAMEREYGQPGAGLRGVALASARKVACPRGHPYDMEMAGNRRGCRTCLREAYRRYNAKRSAAMRQEVCHAL